MNIVNRFKAPLLLATALALPIVTNGCSSVTDAQAAVCCTEFKAGGTVDVKIGGNAEAQVAVQAIADFSGIAAAGIDDITTACRGLATDLGADQAATDKAEQTADKRDKMKAWCDLAVTTITTIKGKLGGTLTLDIQPPACEASVSAKANCQAKCSGSASCDLKANPPKCTGGSLSVACKGECKAKAGVALNCTGTCSGTCKGSCTAKGGVAVQCSGKCEGKCSADAQGNGNGLNASGECTGFCDAKCTANATAPAVSCSGSCSGECSASCTGSADASVTCDGDCQADYQPLQCSGGKLEGGCKVEAKCDANCDASVSAKAECTPPRIGVKFTGSFDATVASKIQASFEANLPLIFAFAGRLEGMAKLTETITGNASVIADIKASCILQVGAAALAAVQDVTASISATGSIVGSVK